MPETADIVILGSGSTAFAAALRGSALGVRVTLIEKGALGGTCINWGCIPSKTLISSARIYHEAAAAGDAGLLLSREGIDFRRLAGHKDSVVNGLRRTRYLDILETVPGLSVIKGTGRFVDPRTLEVEGQRIRSERFLIATGGEPRIPRIPGADTDSCLTSRSALLLRKLPESLIIIGGGVIAVELGQMYRRLGVRVTILEHGNRLLLPVEEEPALVIQEALRTEGVEIFLNVAVCSIVRDGVETTVTVELDGQRQELRAERALLAVGTAPASSGIGLEAAGVEVDAKGFIRVDERMRTAAPGIWAAGDVVGGLMIATVGAQEGVVAVNDMLTPDCGCRMDYRLSPMAIFTDPEVGMVGYGEAEARQAGFQLETCIFPVADIPRAQVDGTTAGVIKIVAEKGSGRLLGVHLAAPRGVELINEAALALRGRLTVADLANTQHVFPSMGEGLRLCAQGFTRDVRRLSCCAE